MIPYVAVAAFCFLAFVVGLVYGLCEAAAYNDHLSKRDAQTIARARRIECDARELDSGSTDVTVERLEKLYVLPSRWPKDDR